PTWRRRCRRPWPGRGPGVRVRRPPAGAAVPVAAARRCPMARAWAEIDLGAVAHNVTTLRRMVAPARLCAVVKANGYGHGAAPVGRAALEAGADWLAVAQV